MKKSIARLSASLLTLLIFTTCTYAQLSLGQPGQNPEPPVPEHIQTIVANANYVNVNPAQLSGMNERERFVQERELTVMLRLLSTTNVGKLAVMVGSTEGSNDIFYKEFDFGSTGSFGDGTSYTVTGNNITLGLGTYSSFPEYFIEVFPIMDNGRRGPGKRLHVE